MAGARRGVPRAFLWLAVFSLKGAGGDAELWSWPTHAGGADSSGIGSIRAAHADGAAKAQKRTAPDGPKHAASQGRASRNLLDRLGTPSGPEAGASADAGADAGGDARPVFFRLGDPRPYELAAGEGPTAGFSGAEANDIVRAACARRPPIAPAPRPRPRAKQGVGQAGQQDFRANDRVAVLIRGEAFRNDAIQGSRSACCAAGLRGQRAVFESHERMFRALEEEAGFEGVDVFATTYRCGALPTDGPRFGPTAGQRVAARDGQPQAGMERHLEDWYAPWTRGPAGSFRYLDPAKVNAFTHTFAPAFDFWRAVARSAEEGAVGGALRRVRNDTAVGGREGEEGGRNRRVGGFGGGGGGEALTGPSEDGPLGDPLGDPLGEEPLDRGHRYAFVLELRWDHLVAAPPRGPTSSGGTSSEGTSFGGFSSWPCLLNGNALVMTDLRGPDADTLSVLPRRHLPCWRAISQAVYLATELGLRGVQLPNPSNFIGLRGHGSQRGGQSGSGQSGSGQSGRGVREQGVRERGVLLKPKRYYAVRFKQPDHIRTLVDGPGLLTWNATPHDREDRDFPQGRDKKMPLFVDPKCRRKAGKMFLSRPAYLDRVLFKGGLRPGCRQGAVNGTAL